MKKNSVIKQALLGSILVASVFVACRSVPISGRKQLNLVPESTITEQSVAQYREFVNQMPHSNDAKSNARVEDVCKRIAMAADKFLAENNITDQQMQWEFTLIADRRVNAFCMPGGKIVIFTGILPLCKTDDELATVVSHEVSHAIARHSNERLSHEVLRQLGGNILSIVSSRQNAVVRTVINQAYGLGSQVAVILPYSRQHEVEADQMGLAFMAMAGYNPEHAITFWQKMAQQGDSSTPEFLSTHPSDETRIEKVKEFLPNAMQYYHPVKPVKGAKNGKPEQKK